MEYLEKPVENLLIKSNDVSKYQAFARFEQMPFSDKSSIILMHSDHHFCFCFLLNRISLAPSALIRPVNILYILSCSCSVDAPEPHIWKAFLMCRVFPTGAFSNILSTLYSNDFDKLEFYRVREVFIPWSHSLWQNRGFSSFHTLWKWIFFCCSANW